MNRTTMNKKNVFTVLCLLYGGLLMAQVQPPRRLGSTYHTTNDTSKLTDIRERLVQLAMQNPNFEIADRKVSIATYQLAKAKGDWLGAIQPGINLNPLTLQPKGEGNQFLPLWNVTVAIPLNYYTQRKNDVRVARENLYIAEAEKNEKYRDVRLKVLTRYEDYLMYKEMLDLQIRVTQDAYLKFKQEEQNFKDDMVGVDEYNRAFALWKVQQDGRAQAQRNFNVSKLELEYMIGITIDELLGK
jgi:outer membrane protein TolC